MADLLNTTAGQVPARLLAQMRMVATVAKLPVALAEAFADGAAARGLSVTQAEAAAKGIAFMNSAIPASGPGMPRTVDDATLIQLTDEFLGKLTGSDKAQNPVALAQDILLSHLVRVDASTHIDSYVPTSRQGHSWDSPRALATKAADAFAAQIGHRMGLKMAPTMGRDMGDVTLSGIAMQICHAHGVRPANASEAVRFAMNGMNTGGDFSYAITNGLSGVIANGFAAAPPAIQRVASEMSSADYRQRNSVSLSGTAAPSLVIEGEPLKYVQISEKGELMPKVADYAALYAISNQALQNDAAAMNLFGDIARKMLIGAQAQFRNVLLAPLLANTNAGQTMADGVALFHATHANLAVTSGAPSVPTLTTARVGMRKQVDLQGNLLAVEPKYLVVPPDLETLAQQVVAQIAAAQVSNVNPFSGTLEVVTDPGLTNMTTWYLVADPARSQGLVFSFLDGASAPRIESKPGWETLGMEMRMVWPLGAAFIETASWFKNAG